MADAERAKTGGKELIVGFVLGHDSKMRFCEAAFPESASAAGTTPH